MADVTKRQAESTLRKLRESFPAYISEDYGPSLVEHWDWLGVGGPRWSIVWEGGPYEWAIIFPHGGVDPEFGTAYEAVKLPKGVWTEPVTAWAINLYRD
jgi:hypothetical protein